MRNMQAQVSRDADIVVAAMVSIVGSTLIFQGWRLDPLLLLCQALTTSVAIWYGLEAFRLRSKVSDGEGVAGELPPPEEPVDYRAFGGQGPGQAMSTQQQAPGGVGARAWSPADDATAGVSGRWGLPPRELSSSGLPIGETIAYDYYGNPINDLQAQQQQQQPAGYGGQYGDMAAYGGGGSLDGDMGAYASGGGDVRLYDAQPSAMDGGLYYPGGSTAGGEYGGWPGTASSVVAGEWQRWEEPSGRPAADGAFATPAGSRAKKTSFEPVDDWE